MTSRHVIFTGRGLSSIIAVSYGGGGVSDTELGNSKSLHPTSRDDRKCVARVEMLNDPGTIVMDW